MWSSQDATVSNSASHPAGAHGGLVVKRVIRHTSLGASGRQSSIVQPRVSCLFLDLFIEFTCSFGSYCSKYSPEFCIKKSRNYISL